MPASLRWPILWLTFFLISFGLGYPTLNRYDPSLIGGGGDSHEYLQLMVNGPSAAAGHWRYRVLVPYLARPFYLAARGHLGTWNPAWFGMLIVNASLCATCAALLLLLALDIGLGFPTGMLAVMAWFADFVVANHLLAGRIDAIECLLMMWLFLACLRKQYYALPLIGVLGALSKETLLPLAVLFVAGWFWRVKERPWLWFLAMLAASAVALLGLHWVIDGTQGNPLPVAAASIHSLADWYRSTRAIFTDWTLWISFLWPLPFALAGRDRLPEQARMATLLSAATALVLSIWKYSGGNSVRPIFDVSAAWLFLAFAAGAARLSDPPATRPKTPL